MSGARRQDGRLGPFVDGYRLWLLEAGYTPQTTRGMLMVLGQLGRWMDAAGVDVGEVEVAAIEEFLACSAPTGIDGCRLFARCDRCWSIYGRSG